MTVLKLTRTMNNKEVSVVLENVNFFEYSNRGTTIHFADNSNIDVYQSESAINAMLKTLIGNTN